MDKFESMRLFVTVVTENSFVKASEKLGISAQLASKYLAELEKSLQTRLLNRTTRKISLTEAGKSYVERCKQIIFDVESAEAQLSNYQTKVEGVITISAPTSFGEKHLPDLIIKFQDKYPDVFIHIKFTDTKIDMLDGDVDIALRIGNLENSSLIAKKIAPIRMAICASPTYIQRNGNIDSVDAFKKSKYVEYSLSDRSMLFSGMTINPYEITTVPTTIANNGEFLARLAIGGAGVIIQPTFIVSEYLKDNSLIRIMRGFEPEPLGLYLIYPNKQHLPRKIRSFIDFATEFYGDNPYWDS